MLRGFVDGLDERALQAVLAGMERRQTAAHWARALGCTYSGWFALRKELTRRWAPARYPDLCRGLIASDWRLAIPVLEDICTRGAHAEAGPVAAAAMAAMLRLGPGEQWRPQEKLLVAARGLPIHQEKERISRLVALWATGAEGSGQQELHEALRLQLRSIEQWQDWDTMLTAFATTAAVGYPALGERLYMEWKGLVIEQLTPYDIDQPRTSGESWIPWLVDAARAGSGAAASASFLRQLGSWLALAGQTKEIFRRARPLLELLTVDLGGDHAEAQPSHVAEGALLQRASRGDRSLAGIHARSARAARRPSPAPRRHRCLAAAGRLARP